MKKQKGILAAALPIMLSFIVTGCTHSSVTADQTIHKISVEQISASNYKNQISLSGNVTPVETVNLSFKLDGKLSDVFVKDGDMVKIGEKISKLDANEYSLQANAANADLEMAQASISATKAQYNAAKAEYESAKAQADEDVPSKINQAKAQLDLTQKTYDRMKALYEAGVISKSELDEVSAKLTSVSETYKQTLNTKKVVDLQIQAVKKKMEAYSSQVQSSYAEAQKAFVDVQKTDDDVNDTTINSPIDGVVLKKLMSAGETVSAGNPIVVIGKTDSVYIEVGISDKEINMIKPGQMAQLSIYGTDGTRNGVVSEISSLADSSTRTFPVKILVENKDNSLKPGMIASVTLQTGTFKYVLVPLDSVIQHSDSSIVFVYNSSDGTVKEKKVVTDEIVGDMIEISSGLEAGERLVTQGQFMLHDGDTVQLDEEDQK